MEKQQPEIKNTEFLHQEILVEENEKTILIKDHLDHELHHEKLSDSLLQTPHFLSDDVISSPIYANLADTIKEDDNSVLNNFTSYFFLTLFAPTSIYLLVFDTPSIFSLCFGMILLILSFFIIRNMRKVN